MKNKIFNIAGLLLILVTGTSGCQKVVSNLSIIMPQNSAFLIDTTAQSCVDEAANAAGIAPTQSLSAYHFIYPAIELNWADTENIAYIAAMEITFSSTSGLGSSFTCTLTGPELGLVLAGNENWLGDIPVATTVSGKVVPADIKSACSLRCGGVSLPTTTNGTTNTSFTATGQVKIIGMYMGTDQIQKPLTVTAPVTLISE